MGEILGLMREKILGHVFETLTVCFIVVVSVCDMIVFLQGCCVNAPMITVADYSNGSEGYTYNYYVGP